MATILGHLGRMERMLGRNSRAVECFQQSQDILVKLDDIDMLCSFLADRAWVAWSQGNDPEVIRLCTELTLLGQKTGSSSCLLHADWLAASVEWGRGAFDQAGQRCEKTLTAYSHDLQSYSIGAIYILGRVALSRGDTARAEDYFRRVDDMADAPRWQWKAFSLHAFGLLAAARSRETPQQAERATILLGAQNHLFGWLDYFLSPAERSDYESVLVDLKNKLGAEVFAALWEKAGSMPRQQVFAYALEVAGE